MSPWGSGAGSGPLIHRNRSKAAVMEVEPGLCSAAMETTNRKGAVVPVADAPVPAAASLTEQKLQDRGAGSFTSLLLVS